MNIRAQTQNTFLFHLLCVDRGPKYHLLAHTTLSLSHVQDSFRTHDLTISGNGEWQPQSICLLNHLSLSSAKAAICLFFVLLPLITVSLPFLLHSNNFPLNPSVPCVFPHPPPSPFLCVLPCSLTDSHCEGHSKKKRLCS